MIDLEAAERRQRIMTGVNRLIRMSRGDLEKVRTGWDRRFPPEELMRLVQQQREGRTLGYSKREVDRNNARIYNLGRKRAPGSAAV